MTSPFDALRPFKSNLVEFTPRENIPWEELATQYLSYGTADKLHFRSAEVVKTILNELIERLALPPNAMILDIGCGPGLYSHGLAELGYRVVGIDIAQPFLDYAQTQVMNLPLQYQNLSMLDMNFTQKFEAILLISSIGPLLDLTGLHLLLAKIQTALKPGGHLVAEFMLAPPDFATQTATCHETISFHQESPWSNQFHVWLLRDLLFPSEFEHAIHHLILAADQPIQEYWSRHTLYSWEQLKEILAHHNLQLQSKFGETLAQPKRLNNYSWFVQAINL